MFWLTTNFALVLLCAASIQLFFAVLFWRYFEELSTVRVQDAPETKVAVLMCVRGCDPSLRGGLIRLLQQNYRRYDVHLVVDNQLDTAWRVAQQVKKEFDTENRLQIHELQNRLPTCGLKCSSLIQGLSYLKPDTEYLLLTDSDVIAHSEWIADLVGPLESDPKVGLVCGTQWFEPPASSTWGALVRSSWNAGAMVPTIVFRNPWAGTIAMRVSDIHQGQFAETWRNSMVDDGPLADLMKKLGKEIRFAPSLIMINNENCTFRYATGWVTRMLTWSRLYEPTFYWAAIHAVFSNSVMIGLFIFFGMALIGQQWIIALIGATGLVGSGVLSVAAYATSRRAAERSCELSGRELAPLSIARLVKLFFTVPLAQVVYLIGVVQAGFAKQVCWREISYEIKSKDNVRLISYAPFKPKEPAQPSDFSEMSL